jgi:hypothetical protein
MWRPADEMREQTMTNQHLELFDGDDVDGPDESVDDGPDGFDDGDLSAAEIAGIKASQADPGTPGPDAEGN